MKTFSLLPLLFGGAIVASAQSVPPADAPADQVKLDQFVVTASVLGRAPDEIAQPASVLAGRALDRARRGSLGETLAAEPGVSSTYFGPGASRPVIRGLGGDRVRVLTGGVGTMDASVVSPDHAVSLDPLLIDRVELLRGPVTLLYGGSAIGGVVNVIDSRVLEEKPAAAGGRVSAQLGTAADERSTAAVFTGGAGAWAWRLDGFTRRTDDLRIPDYAATAEKRVELAAHGEPIARGTLPNSATATDGAGFGLTRFLGRDGGAGHLGVSFSGLDSRYGVVAEPDVTIGLRQRRWDVHSELNAPAPGLRLVKFQLGVSDYRHTEFEGDEVGTVFTNQGYEGRLELLHAPVGVLSGALGLQVARSDFAALGEEAFLPSTVTTNRALFVYEELARGAVTWEFGARLEQQEIAPAAGTGWRDRADTFASFSAGAVWKLPSDYALAVSLTRSARAPNAQELFADGPHAGTGTYEVGDAGLRAEKVLGFDLSLRRTAGPVTGAVTVFAHRFDGFIAEHPTGATDVDSGLPVYQFEQSDARFLGAEFEVAFRLQESAGSRAELRLTADVVRADDLANDEPLPRLPPARVGAEFEWRTGPWTLTLDARSALRQDRVSDEETATPGYALFGASVTRAFRLERMSGEFFLRGTNLADATARVSTSFLKDIAPLPGRDFAAGVRFAF